MAVCIGIAISRRDGQNIQVLVEGDIVYAFPIDERAR